MSQFRTRSRAEGRTKTTFALPESDYARLETLSQSFSLSIRSILDNLAAEAHQILTPDNADPLLPITETCLRKSYGISMESKRIFEELAKSRGVSRNQLVHTVLNRYCQSLVQYLQELPHRNTVNAQKLMEMCGRMLEIYEQSEYAGARKELATTEGFAACHELLAHVECLYELEAALQAFTATQQAPTVTAQHG